MIQRGPSSMLLVLFYIGVVQGQMPFRPKFLAGGSEDSPFLEAQRDALNLHEGDAESVSLAAPITIDCTARGTDLTDTLFKKGACSRPIPAGCKGQASSAVRIRPWHR
jgi:hypothetical protein